MRLKEWFELLLGENHTENSQPSIWGEKVKDLRLREVKAEDIGIKFIYEAKPLFISKRSEEQVVKHLEKRMLYSESLAISE